MKDPSALKMERKALEEIYLRPSVCKFHILLATLDIEMFDKFVKNF